MEQKKHWRAEPTRSGRVHRRINRGRCLRAAVATGAMVAVTLPVLSSDAAVGGQRTIEVTTGSDLVILTGYPRNAKVKIVVARKGNVIGFATKRTNGAGEIELNHSGGAARDCFESPTTPNIRPRDVIRTRILSNGVRDSSVVRGVWIDDVQSDATSITASGRVNQGTGPSGVTPGTDVLELRVRTDGNDVREDIGASVNPDGTWTHEIGGLTAQEVANAEVVLEWSKQVADELTVAEFGVSAARLPGCPPLAN
jgi:hypothetical protein